MARHARHERRAFHALQWLRRSSVFSIVFAAVVGTSGAAAYQPGSRVTHRGYEVPVVTAGSGFTVWRSGFASYGVVLKSRESRRDAREVRIQVTLLDGHQRRLGSDVNILTRLSANRLFYFGGTIAFSGGRPATLKTLISVGWTSPRIQRLPQITTSSVRNLPGVGVSVQGEVKNTSLTLLDRDALISVVAFDQRGRVRGGGSDLLLSKTSVPPGSTRRFRVFVFGLTKSSIARVSVSIEPRLSSP